MAFTGKAALLVRTMVILLCKLLLVDVICSFVCSWLLYYVFTYGVRSPRNPRATTKSTGGIQVIICGFPRTGTASLWQAMDILGFPCFHGYHLLKPTNCTLLWKAQTSGTHYDWEVLLHDFEAIADFPAAAAYKNLMEVYPNAKVILNVRDPDSWYKSISQTFLPARQSLEFQIIQPYIQRCSKAFLDKVEDKEACITRYNLHIEEVKKHVPSHKLYIMELENREGWDPLCNFLEVPVPNVPFPSVNDTQSFNNQFIKKGESIFRIVIVSYLAIVFYFIIHVWNWMFSK